MLELFGRKSSFNVQKIMWFIAELELSCHHIEVGGSFGGLNNEEFRAMNPHGRVPVIDDGGIIVWESHAILRYLAARYGSPKFWNDDPAVQSQADRWMDWAQTALQPDFLNGVFWGFYRTPEAQRDMTAVNAKIASTAYHLRLLDQVLEDKTYLVGADLSLADIPAGTTLYRYFNIDIDRPHLANVERWYDALQERPAYREGIMVPFDELYGRLDY
jgi:glutathione S-transferase